MPVEDWCSVHHTPRLVVSKHDISWYLMTLIYFLLPSVQQILTTLRCWSLFSFVTWLNPIISTCSDVTIFRIILTLILPFIFYVGTLTTMILILPPGCYPCRMLVCIPTRELWTFAFLRHHQHLPLHNFIWINLKWFEAHLYLAHHHIWGFYAA